MDQSPRRIPERRDHAHPPADGRRGPIRSWWARGPGCIQRNWLEHPVGTLYKKVTQTVDEPLPLREACNKIIHAKHIVLDSNESTNPYRHFIKPTIFCHEHFEQQKGWKAVIDVHRFVGVCDGICAMFA